MRGTQLPGAHADQLIAAQSPKALWQPAWARDGLGGLLWGRQVGLGLGTVSRQEQWPLPAVGWPWEQAQGQCWLRLWDSPLGGPGPKPGWVCQAEGTPATSEPAPCPPLSTLLGTGLIQPSPGL